MSSFINAGLFFLITSIILLFAVFLFNFITRHNMWQEIASGNLSMAMCIGGIVLGIANIMRVAISVNTHILPTIVWGGIGTVALIIVYFAFEFLTPKLNVKKEIDRDNKAVGFISLMFSLAFSFIIGACIS